METRIMFLIIALLALYLMFSESGQKWLKKYVGLNITPVSGPTSTNKAPAEKFSGGAIQNNVTGGGMA